MPTPPSRPNAKMIHDCSPCHEELEYPDMTHPTRPSGWRNLYDGCDAYGWIDEDGEIFIF